MPATAVLPDAVVPKSARTLYLGRLLEAMLELRGGPRALEGPVLLGMRCSPFAEPCDRTRYAFGERRPGLPAEQPARLADVRDVVRHLAEQRRCMVNLRLDAEFGGDQFGGTHERVALAVGEVDRLVGDSAFRERVDAKGDAVDAVVDEREVEHL